MPLISAGRKINKRRGFWISVDNSLISLSMKISKPFSFEKPLLKESNEWLIMFCGFLGYTSLFLRKNIHTEDKFLLIVSAILILVVILFFESIFYDLGSKKRTSYSNSRISPLFHFIALFFIFGIIYLLLFCITNGWQLIEYLPLSVSVFILFLIKFYLRRRSLALKS